MAITSFPRTEGFPTLFCSRFWVKQNNPFSVAHQPKHNGSTMSTPKGSRVLRMASTISVASLVWLTMHSRGSSALQTAAFSGSGSLDRACARCIVLPRRVMELGEAGDRGSGTVSLNTTFSMFQSERKRKKL